jgi:hypothetical protein
MHKELILNVEPIIDQLVLFTVLSNGYQIAFIFVENWNLVPFVEWANDMVFHACAEINTDSCNSCYNYCRIFCNQTLKIKFLHNFAMEWLLFYRLFNDCVIKTQCNTVRNTICWTCYSTKWAFEFSKCYTSITNYQINQITIAFYSVFEQVRTVRKAHIPSFSIFRAIKYRTDLDQF